MIMCTCEDNFVKSPTGRNHPRWSKSDKSFVIDCDPRVRERLMAPDLWLLNKRSTGSGLFSSWWKTHCSLSLWQINRLSQLKQSLLVLVEWISETCLVVQSMLLSCVEREQWMEVNRSACSLFAFLIETTFSSTFHLRVTERGPLAQIGKRTQNTHLKRVLSTPKQEMHVKCKYSEERLSFTWMIGRERSFLGDQVVLESAPKRNVWNDFVPPLPRS